MTNDVPPLGMGPIRDLLTTLSARDMRLHSLIVHRAGDTVLDYWQWPHEPRLRHRTHSATKSFTGTAVGLAEAEGLLTLDDPVAGFFADHATRPADGHFADLRVRHLLTMQTGHARGLSGAATRLLETGWVEEFLREPVVEEPGHNFVYSSTTSHVLSAIVQKVSGLPVDAYLRPRLFEPLGITDYTWERDPEGVASGGNGLSMLPSDLLKFGVLHLQDGVWEGRRILPEGWVAKVSAPHVTRAINGVWNGTELLPPPADAVADSGYGYQFWATEDGIYSASGIFGQECMIFSEQGGVVVVTGAMGGETYHDLPDLLRDAFRAAFAGPDPDAAAEAGAAAEVERLTGAARLPEPAAPAARHTGRRTVYDFGPNDQGLRSLAVDVREDSVVLEVEDDLGRHTVVHGVGHWIRQETGVSVGRLHHSYQDESAAITAAAAWAGGTGGTDALHLTWHFLEAPFIDRLTLSFGAGDVTVEHTVNVNSGLTALPPARGVLRG